MLIISPLRSLNEFFRCYIAPAYDGPFFCLPFYGRIVSVFNPSGVVELCSLITAVLAFSWNLPWD